MTTASICMMDIFSTKRRNSLEKLSSKKLTGDLYRLFHAVSFSILKLFEFKNVIVYRLRFCLRILIRTLTIAVVTAQLCHP